jgi:hypothetical protein
VPLAEAEGHRHRQRLLVEEVQAVQVRLS